VIDFLPLLYISHLCKYNAIIPHYITGLQPPPRIPDFDLTNVTLVRTTTPEPAHNSALYYIPAPVPQPIGEVWLCSPYGIRTDPVVPFSFPGFFWLPRYGTFFLLQYILSFGYSLFLPGGDKCKNAGFFEIRISLCTLPLGVINLNQITPFGATGPGLGPAAAPPSSEEFALPVAPSNIR